MKSFLGMLIVLFFVSSLSAAESSLDSTCTIQGRVTFKKDITVTVTCLTQKEFEDELPAQYFYVRQPDASDLNKGYIDYTISDIPEGDYIIFAFQDKNDNDKLDRFLIVPKEYWDIYGLARPTKGKPNFDKLSLHINKNISQLDMTLKNGF